MELELQPKQNAKLQKTLINKMCTLYTIFLAVKDERKCESAKQRRQFS